MAALGGYGGRKDWRATRGPIATTKRLTEGEQEGSGRKRCERTPLGRGI